MSARGLIAKPTTRKVMVHIRVFLYQGYDIRFYCEAHCSFIVVCEQLIVCVQYIKSCLIVESTKRRRHV
jgi:hypothetical protein